MAVVDRTRPGREQRRRSAVGRARRPNLDKWYGKRLPAITPGAFEFRLDLLRGRGVPAMPLDAFTESFEWNDEESALSGNLQLRRPDPSSWESLPIGRGHLVRCRVRWVGDWYELWTMRCDPPQVTVETGLVSVDVKDDLALVRQSSRRWVYRATKRRPHGWFGHDILRDAARKEGIRLGAIAKCTKRLKKIDVRGSFLDLATRVYENEHSSTERKFVLRMRDGRFEVVPYARNRTLYVLAEQIRSASLTAKPKVENPATVLTGHARIGKGHKAKKVMHTEYRRALVDRYGYSHKSRSYGRLDSIGELRARVRRDLAKQFRFDTSLTVQHQGIPFIRRGDGAQVLLPSDRIVGDRSFVFVTAARHQVQGGVYTTEWDLTAVDPFEADRVAREKALREQARKARSRRRRGAH